MSDGAWLRSGDCNAGVSRRRPFLRQILRWDMRASVNAVMPACGRYLFEWLCRPVAPFFRTHARMPTLPHAGRQTCARGRRPATVHGRMLTYWHAAMSAVAHAAMRAYPHAAMLAGEMPGMLAWEPPRMRAVRQAGMMAGQHLVMPAC